MRMEERLTSAFAHLAGKIDGEMVFVGSDNPDASGLERGRKHGISTFVVDYGAIIRGYKHTPESAVAPEDFNEAEVRTKMALLSTDTDPEKATAFMRTRAIAEYERAKVLERCRRGRLHRARRGELAPPNPPYAGSAAAG